jgi:cell fate (sporulation/competence/biofilm development) regulator YlbF (YheA/YmcA/DUF963 family)
MLEDKAKELGRLIGQSPEYLTMKRATEGLNGDTDAAALLREMEGVRTEAQGMIERGEQPTPEMEGKLDDMLSQIQTNANYQRAVAAQENFDKMMLRVNNWIAEGIRKGAASPIITLG